MMFGNLPGGKTALAAVENELRTRFADPEFELDAFIGDTCNSDPNVARFFRLNPQDIEMMVKIVEWGKANAATVSSCLASGPGAPAFAALAAEDPGVVIGQCLTELTMSIRKGADINRVLLTSLEAVSRCLRPACAILAFFDAGRQSLVGRFFLSASAKGRATDFRVGAQETQSPFLRAIAARETVAISARREGVASVLKTWNVDATLAVPVVVFGNAIGLCVVGRETGLAYSEQEREWVEAVIGQVSLAFERSR
jgi:GAF domain-containing protein